MQLSWFIGRSIDDEMLLFKDLKKMEKYTLHVIACRNAG